MCRCILSHLILSDLTLRKHRWRRMRKASHEGFNKAVVHRYHPFQFRESVLLTSSLIAKPADWDNHLRRSAASSVMSVVYATPPVEENDPSVKNVNDHVNRLTRANLPGAHFVQFIPWLRYVLARYEWILMSIPSADLAF